MKRLIMVLALLVMLVSLTSCNMLRGAGQDIESVGDAVQDIAN